jgi:sulfur-oxidizing protein SoxA
MKQPIVPGLAVALALAALPCAVQAQAKPLAKGKKPVAAQPAVEVKDATTAEFEKFREVMEDANPAELFEMKGEELWKTKRGPNKVSLAESCDLGLGVGVVKGAYVQMPRYFADADKVMDVERRIVWCMVEKQGYKYEELAKKPFATDTFTPDATNLVTYVAGESRNMKIAAHTEHPREKEIYAIGKEIFAFRSGPYDFACATCHGEDNKRIRMQQLPNLAKKEEAIRAYQGWPGYRMTGGVMLTQQWRMNDCFRQQRFPEPKYVSDTVTALLTYLTVNANGNMYKGPGIKR